MNIFVCLHSRLYLPLSSNCFFPQGTLQVSRTGQWCKDCRWQSLTVTIWNLCFHVKNWTVILWGQKPNLLADMSHKEQEKRVCPTAAVGCTNWSCPKPNTYSQVGVVRWGWLAGGGHVLWIDWCQPALACVLGGCNVHFCASTGKVIVVGNPSWLRLCFLAWGGFSRWQGLCFQDTSHGRFLCSTISASG